VTDQLILKNDQKIIFLVFDGLGDIPDPNHSHQTPLEAALKPNIDRLAIERGALGRTIPVGVGITPGSGPGHLSLFGYDPAAHEIGRGILEVLGLNMDIAPGDVTARGNFCTLAGDGIVADRRAGRIETALGEELCGRLSKAIPSVDSVTVTIKPAFPTGSASSSMGRAFPTRSRMQTPTRTANPSSCRLRKPLPRKRAPQSSEGSWKRPWRC